MSEEQQISITVRTQYLPEHSEPDENRYTFGYTVTIRNLGDTPSKLLTRHWIITDSNGQSQEVHGEGVVGEQPLIQPKQQFQYSSGTILKTPVGSMHGSYTMLNDCGHHFDATIPPFGLAVPELVN